MSKIVLFEGHDGVGKSTLLDCLVEKLTQQDYKVIVLHTPLPNLCDHRKEAEENKPNV